VEEKILLRTALVCSLVGIGIVFLMSQVKTTIAEIDESLVGQPVKIIGKVSEVNHLESLSVLQVYDDTGAIDVVVFEGVYELGQDVELRGEVSKYNEELQVVVN
jgi:RecJ-like exonuclease